MVVTASVAAMRPPSHMPKGLCASCREKAAQDGSGPANGKSGPPTDPKRQAGWRNGSFA